MRPQPKTLWSRSDCLHSYRKILLSRRSLLILCAGYALIYFFMYVTRYLWVIGQTRIRSCRCPYFWKPSSDFPLWRLLSFKGSKPRILYSLFSHRDRYPQSASFSPNPPRLLFPFACPAPPSFPLSKWTRRGSCRFAWIRTQAFIFPFLTFGRQ